MCLYEPRGEQNNSRVFINWLFAHPTGFSFFWVAMTCWLTLNFYPPAALMTLLAEVLLPFLLWSVCASFSLPMTYSPAHRLSALSPVWWECVKFLPWSP